MSNIVYHMIDNVCIHGVRVYGIYILVAVYLTGL